MAYRLGVIGGGNMGSAIVRGALKKQVLAPEQMIVAEVDQARRHTFVSMGVVTTASPAEAAQADQIILAVKPQSFVEAARAIRPVGESKVVISIMAGLGSEAIRRALGGQGRIVRAMPNTPCQIGAGMTAIAIGAGAKSGDERLALAVFGALGRTVVLHESLMHAVTAVSGSGPAYVFLLAEAMEQAAIALGIDAKNARILVEQTMHGAGRLLAESSEGAAALRAAVTSPGGTTAAALNVFQQRDFNRIVIEALTAARDRGQELDRT